MPIRPRWSDGYWNRLDKETSRKMRTTCPHCGSADTYYNQHYKAWRCNKCEYSFTVKGLGDKKPWWKRILGR